MTKTISLSDEAYEALAALKNPGESFSDVALRLGRVQGAKSLAGLAGRWRMFRAEADAMKDRIGRERDASERGPVKL